jgi:hypothetical protein
MKKNVPGRGAGNARPGQHYDLSNDQSIDHSSKNAKLSTVKNIANRARSLLTQKYTSLFYPYKGCELWIATVIRLYFFRQGAPVIRPRFIQIDHLRIIRSLGRTELAEKMKKKWLGPNGKPNNNYWRVVNCVTARVKEFGDRLVSDEEHKDRVVLWRYQPDQRKDKENGCKFFPNIYILSDGAIAWLKERIGDLSALAGFLDIEPGQEKPKKQRKPKIRKRRQYKREPAALKEEYKRQAAAMEEEPAALESDYQRQAKEDNQAARPGELEPIKIDPGAAFKPVEKFKKNSLSDCHKEKSTLRVNSSPTSKNDKQKNSPYPSSFPQDDLAPVSDPVPPVKLDGSHGRYSPSSGIGPGAQKSIQAPCKPEPPPQKPGQINDPAKRELYQAESWRRSPLEVDKEIQGQKISSRLKGIGARLVHLAATKGRIRHKDCSCDDQEAGASNNPRIKNCARAAAPGDRIDPDQQKKEE